MLDFIVLFFGINMVEAILYVLFVLGRKIKDVGRFELIGAITGVTTINYLSSALFKFPMASQIVLAVFGSVFLSYVFDLDLKNTCKKFLIVVAFLFLEVPVAFLYDILFHIKVINEPNNIKILLLIPCRVYEYFVLLLLMNKWGVINMKTWFGNIEKKDTKKVK